MILNKRFLVFASMLLLLMLSVSVEAANLIVYNNSAPSQTPYFVVNGTTTNVGIGTGTPGEKLQVSGKVNATDFCIQGGACLSQTGSAIGNLSGAGVQNYIAKFSGTTVISSSILYETTGGSLGISSTAPNYKLEINNAAAGLNVSNLLFANSTNVGIGTSNPGSKLVVTGTGSSLSFDAVTGYSGLIGFNRNVLTGSIYNSAQTAYQITADASKLAFQVFNGAGGSISGNALVVANNSYIGIGTLTPSQRLDVRGLANFSGTIYLNNDTDVLNYINTNIAGNSSGGAGNNTATYVPYIGSSKNIDLGANNFTVDTNALFVNANTNNVGIGTASPNATLDVNGNEIVRGTIYGSNNTNGVLTLDSTTYPENSTNSFTGSIIIGPSHGFGRQVNVSIGVTGFRSNYGLSVATNGGRSGITIANPTSGNGGEWTMFTSNPANNGNGFAIRDEVANAERLYIAGNETGSGNVGIGTHSPTEKLSVSGNFSTTGGTYLATSSGNVGIGTTAPGQKLDVRDGQILSSHTSGGALNYSILNITIAAATLQRGGIDFGIVSGGNSFLSFSTLSGTYGERLRIADNGNIGIGTPSPSQKLDVNGNARIQGIGNFSGTVYINNGTDLSTVVAGSGINSWNVSGSNLFPSDLAYNVSIGAASSLGFKLNLNGSLKVSGPVSSESAYRGTDAGLVLYLPFSEDAGTKAFDRSPSGFVASLTNSFYNSSGKYGGGLTITGTTTSTAAVTLSNVNVSDYTISYWENSVENQGVNADFLLGSTAFYSYQGGQFRVVNNPALYACTNAGGYFGTSAANPALTGQWINIIFTSNQGNLSGYVNGVYGGSCATSGNSSIGPTLLFGGAYGADRNFNGTIDEVMFWNRSLTDSEIRSLYGNDLGSHGNLVTPSFNYQNTTGTSLLFVNGTSGNAGIGTTASNYKLEVNGNFNASNNLFVNSTNVGIGTTAPFGKFAVAGTGKDGTAASFGNGVSNNYLTVVPSATVQTITTDWVASGAETPIALGSWTNRANQLYLATSGNVGIGTTTPSQRLDVNGSLIVQGVGNFSGVVYVNNGTEILNYINTNIAGNSSGGAGNSSATYVPYVGASKNINLGANNLTTSGILSITGTGGTYINSSASSGATFIQLQKNTISNYYGIQLFQGGTEKWGIGYEGGPGLTGGELTFNDGNQNAKIVFQNNTGNVGIGTVTPSQKLDVRGVGNFSGTVYINNGTDLSTIVAGSGINSWNLSGSNLYPSSLAYLVGIGTTAPHYPLDILYNGGNVQQRITSNSTETQIQLANGGAGGRTYNIASSSSSGSQGAGFLIYDMNGSATRFKIDATGNIGIGTITPSQTLDVRGIGNFSGTVYINNGTDISTFITSSVANTPWDNSSSQIFIRGGFPQTLNVSNNLFVNSTTITAGINAGVGIGTSSPETSLDIRGNYPQIELQKQSIGSPLYVYQHDQFSGIVTGRNPASGTFKDVSYSAAEIGFNANATGGGSAITFATASTNNTLQTTKVTIDGTGNVGIGTTTPSQKLDVRGIGNFSGVVYVNNGTEILNYINTNINANNTGSLANGTGTYVPYAGASANINLGAYNLSNVGTIGIGTANAQARLHVNGTFLVTNLSGSQGLNQNVNGYVGIGTSPGYPLDVNGIIHGKGELLLDSDGTNDGLYIQNASSQTTIAMVGTALASSYVNTGGKFGIGTNTPLYTLDVQGTIGLNNSLYVIGSGNVGINTASPNEKLEVNGNVRLNNTLNVAPNKDLIINSSTGTGNVVIVI